MKKDIMDSGNEPRKRFLFVSDLHGRRDRYEKLLALVKEKNPPVLLLGGDILPRIGPDEFLQAYLLPSLKSLRNSLGNYYPHIGLILGNDDPRSMEEGILQGEAEGYWDYLHNRKKILGGIPVFGCSYIPPSPFLLKDWERYDVSRFVDPGCVSPLEGFRTVPVDPNEIENWTILDTLDRLTEGENVSDAVFLFHSPPYQTNLDRAALDGRFIDSAPLDVHVGSIAVRRWIEQREPLITLHGHIHESARLTGEWRDRLRRTYCFSASHDGCELSAVWFDPRNPEDSERWLY